MADAPPLGRSVIVVDDSGVFGFTLSLEFRKHGWDVFCCGNAEEAIRKVREKHFDLVLADVFMPGMRGDEMAGLLLKEFPDLKIIVMSSMPRENLPPLPRKVAFIPKPVDVAMVLSAFDRVNRASTGVHLSHEPPPPPGRG
jgi:two-component system cell cycle response regulator CpdR